MSRRPARRRLLAALCATCALALLPGAALASAPPSLGVSGAILIEQSTGKVLYAVNPDRRLAIASATKLAANAPACDASQWVGVRPCSRSG